MTDSKLILPGQPEKSPGGTEISTEPGTAETQAEQPEFIEAKTAFIIFVQDDGTVVMTPDLSTTIVTERAPTINEIFSACGVVMKDIQNQETAALSAQFVMNAQMQMAAKMRDAQLNAQAMQGLKLR